MLLLLLVICVRYVVDDGEIVDSQLYFELLRVDGLLFFQFVAHLDMTRCHVMHGIWLLLSLVAHHLDEVFGGRVVHAYIQRCLLNRYILLFYRLEQILALLIVEHFVLALRLILAGRFARGSLNATTIFL